MIRLFRRRNRNVVELGGVVPRLDFVEWMDDDGAVHTADRRDYIAAKEARQGAGARAVRLQIVRIEGRKLTSSRHLGPGDFVVHEPP